MVKLYKIWYMLGISFMAIFMLLSIYGTLSTLTALLSLICFGLSAINYKDNE